MASAHQRGNPILTANFRKDKKASGGDLLTLYPNALNVIWGGSSTSNRYWKRVKDGSDEVLELVGVYWLEVSGKLLLSRFKPSKTYKLTFQIKLKQDATGWDNYDVFFNLRLTGQRSKQQSIKLSTIEKDKWLCVPSGQEGSGVLEFTVPDQKTLSSQTNMALTFAMYEIECEDLKTGLMIKSVQIEEKI